MIYALCVDVLNNQNCYLKYKFIIYQIIKNQQINNIKNKAVFMVPYRPYFLNLFKIGFPLNYKHSNKKSNLTQSLRGYTYHYINFGNSFVFYTR